MSLGDLTTLFSGNIEEQRKKNLMLLGEIDSLLRTLPSLESFASYSDDSTQWRGKVKAVLRAWDSIQAVELTAALSSIDSPLAQYKQAGLGKLKALLHHARFDLQITTGEGINSAYDTGSVFSYFDDARKLFEQAVTDIFVIDPWLDTDFVSRYLPGVKNGVSIRLLTAKNKLNTLVPSVEMFVAETKASVAIRIDNALHDRYLIIDGASCYQSGASFKDGARKAPTTLTQIVDAFGAVRDTYESKWAVAPGVP